MIDLLPDTTLERELSMSTRKPQDKKTNASEPSGVELVGLMVIMVLYLLDSLTIYLLELWAQP